MNGLGISGQFLLIRISKELCDGMGWIYVAQSRSSDLLLFLHSLILCDDTTSSSYQLASNDGAKLTNSVELSTARETTTCAASR
jgi:hypothetical protein